MYVVIVRTVIITTYISVSAPVKRLYPYEGDTLIDFKLKCEKIKIPRGGIRIYGKRHNKCFVCNIMYHLFNDSQVFIDQDSLRASSPIWASEVSLARTRERGAEERRACNQHS